MKGSSWSFHETATSARRKAGAGNLKGFETTFPKLGSKRWMLVETWVKGLYPGLRVDAFRENDFVFERNLEELRRSPTHRVRPSVWQA